MEQLLNIEKLQVYYGAIHALRGISLHVNEGEIVSLIGANGAGKTTLMSAIMRQIPIAGGSISFCGEALEEKQTAQIVRSGMTLVPEGRHVFPRSSVEDNLLLGAYFRRDKAAVREDMARAYETFPRLKIRFLRP